MPPLRLLSLVVAWTYPWVGLDLLLTSSGRKDLHLILRSTCYDERGISSRISSISSSSISSSNDERALESIPLWCDWILQSEMDSGSRILQRDSAMINPCGNSVVLLQDLTPSVGYELTLQYCFTFLDTKIVSIKPTPSTFSIVQTESIQLVDVNFDVGALLKTDPPVDSRYTMLYLGMIPLLEMLAVQESHNLALFMTGLVFLCLSLAFIYTWIAVKNRRESKIVPYHPSFAVAPASKRNGGALSQDCYNSNEQDRYCYDDFYSAGSREQSIDQESVYDYEPFRFVTGHALDQNNRSGTSLELCRETPCEPSCSFRLLKEQFSKDSRSQPIEQPDLLDQVSQFENLSVPTATEASVDTSAAKRRSCTVAADSSVATEPFLQEKLDVVNETVTITNSKLPEAPLLGMELILFSECYENQSLRMTTSLDASTRILDFERTDDTSAKTECLSIYNSDMHQHARIEKCSNGKIPTTMSETVKSSIVIPDRSSISDERRQCPEEDEDHTFKGQSVVNSKSPNIGHGSPPGRLIVLLSNEMSNRFQRKDQHRAMMLLKARRTPYSEVDATDPCQRDRRNELVAISGVRAVYPQFFLEQQDGITTYIGNWESLQEINESSCIDKGILAAHPEIRTWDNTFKNVVESFDKRGP